MDKTTKKEIKTGLSAEAGNKIAQKIRQAQFKRQYNENPKNEEILGGTYSEEDHKYIATLDTPPHIRMTVKVILNKCKVIYSEGKSIDNCTESIRFWTKKEYYLTTEQKIEGVWHDERCRFDLSLCIPGEAIVIGAIEEGLANGIIDQTEEEKKVQWRDPHEFDAIDSADRAASELG